MIAKARELLKKLKQWNQQAGSGFYRVRYTSVPVWKPWREF